MFRGHGDVHVMINRLNPSKSMQISIFISLIVTKAVFMCAIWGANLYPGCIFGHVNGDLWICTRVQICKFAPTFEVVQIYLHPGAICAHERKMFFFFILRSGILMYAGCYIAGCFYYESI